MAPIEDIIILSLSAFLGNVGVALTGFGMAIIYLFVYQIIVLAGYDGDFKYAVFIQALALFCAQPLLLKKAEVREHASWKMLRYFIPITIISTPIGQVTGDRISTELVEAIGGCLVTFVAIFEMYQKHAHFAKLLRKYCGCGKKKEVELEEKAQDEENPAAKPREESGTDDETSVSFTNFSDVYELGSKLGEGAFSVVKEGVHKLTRKTYAIKLVSRAALLKEEKARLDEETALLLEMKHENILSLLEVRSDSLHYYLVADLMLGGDLLSRLNEVSFFSELEGRRIVKMVLDATCHMHKNNIVHRDLKPENLLLASKEPDAVVKVADFGFAKKTITPLTTMCGTPAYTAPEILKGLAYGSKVDMFSIGVIVWALLAGYQPFRGENEQELQCAIRKGDFVFDKEFWKSQTDEAKKFISSLLASDPKARVSAGDAFADPWFTKELGESPSRGEDTKVFFMIGSQRSGSNWLRTMLDEREDLAGPHPPHIMRDFLPIIDKFGDISDVDNFRVLVDHVCNFVERNQVPWTDKHGSNIKFPRPIVCAKALQSCERVKGARGREENHEGLEKGMYLLSVFDAIMHCFTIANGKRLWLCKSMGMSKFHDLLLEFYGPKRLRYIYLVRDPRDVAMSFMKTPVGDCHWHAIATKWTNLQQHALGIVDECPELIHQVHYEDMLEDKENVVKGVYDFIGERRFGGVKRQASVLCMHKTEDIINNAKKGRESIKAKRLSCQFQNLGRGPSFANVQNQKWRHPETGLKQEELEIVETVAHDVMGKLGYATHIVGEVCQPRVWSNEDLLDFKAANEEGIARMNDDLGKENPADLARRQHQAAALELEPDFTGSAWGEGSVGLDIDESFRSGMAASLRKKLLNDREVEARRQIDAGVTHSTKDGQRFRWASVTQRGYYPDHHDKPNQDDQAILLGIGEEGSAHLFSVFDGHGLDGHLCAAFASKIVPKEFRKWVAREESWQSALEKAHTTAHEQIVAIKGIETEQSGTTATTLLLVDDKCIISNVGDSTAMLGWQDTHLTKSAKYLCTPQTPIRADERKRIERAGGVVMTADQRDGLALMHENWTEHDAPPRIWSSVDGLFPGCCFTRSIGDETAHTLGVTALPEFFEHQIEARDRCLILASDGVTEFMDADTCVEIACRHKNPTEAVRALCQEATERWLAKGDYMDDITAIVIFFDLDKYGERYGSKEFLVTLEESGTDSEERDVEAALFGGEKEDEAAGGEKKDEEDIPLGLSARFWTLLAGGASGFLGGLCGIRGPPIILYFLHPPYPVSFDKKKQRATGASITATNVAMRIAYYLVETLAFDGENYFSADDWVLYVCIAICSIGGVLVGSEIFDRMKDSRNNIRMILSIFLLLCGISLLLSSFAKDI